VECILRCAFCAKHVLKLCNLKQNYNYRIVSKIEERGGGGVEI
jgi:hypothetical protein